MVQRVRDVAHGTNLKQDELVDAASRLHVHCARHSLLSINNLLVLHTAISDIQLANIKILSRGDALFLSKECESFVLQHRGDKSFDPDRPTERVSGFPRAAFSLWLTAAEQWLKMVR